MWQNSTMNCVYLYYLCIKLRYNVFVCWCYMHSFNSQRYGNFICVKQLNKKWNIFPKY